MANLVLVIGDTGTGKSTSIGTLNADETAIINVLGKPLPFPGSRKMYNGEKKNIKEVSTSVDIVASLEGLKTVPHIKNIILDDVGFSMLNEFFDKASVTGFDKFAKMGVNMQKIIATAKQLPHDKNVIMMFHDDLDNESGKMKVKLIGRMLEDKYNPLSMVSVCLFTDVTFDKDKRAQYSFVTNRTLSERNVIIPAKSPMGMFEDLRIPNDLNLVLTTINNYYNGE